MSRCVLRVRSVCRLRARHADECTHSCMCVQACHSMGGRVWADQADRSAKRCDTPHASGAL
eukprot:1854726-Alexandrium_andersonii.AAC.1